MAIFIVIIIKFQKLKLIYTVSKHSAVSYQLSAIAFDARSKLIELELNLTTKAGSLELKVYIHLNPILKSGILLLRPDS